MDENDRAAGSSSGSSSSTSSSSTGAADRARSIEEVDEVVQLFDSLSNPGGAMTSALLQSSELELVFRPLLSHVHADGLDVERAFRREIAPRLPGTNTAVLRITNRRSQALSDIHMKEVENMTSFPEIPSLAPGESMQVEIEVQFQGRANHPCQFTIVTDRGAFSVGLEAPFGELVRPAADSLADKAFQELTKSLTGMHLSTKQWNAKERESVGSLSEAVLLDRLSHAANLAVATGPEGTVRGAGRLLSDPSVNVIVSIGADLQVASDNFMFASGLLNEIAASVTH